VKEVSGVDWLSSPSPARISLFHLLSMRKTSDFLQKIEEALSSLAFGFCPFLGFIRQIALSDYTI
jgi:hypothetical protein